MIDKLFIFVIIERNKKKETTMGKKISKAFSVKALNNGLDFSDRVNKFIEEHEGYFLSDFVESKESTYIVVTIEENEKESD
jgi:hypothetical protein